MPSIWTPFILIWQAKWRACFAVWCNAVPLCNCPAQLTLLPPVTVHSDFMNILQRETVLTDFYFCRNCQEGPSQRTLVLQCCYLFVSCKWLTACPCVFLGLLWNPESPHWKLALPDLCSGSPAKVFTLSKERRSSQTHSEWNKMGPC